MYIYVYTHAYIHIYIYVSIYIIGAWGFGYSFANYIKKLKNKTLHFKRNLSFTPLARYAFKRSRVFLKL